MQPAGISSDVLRSYSGVDCTTIEGKILCSYQGWFCAEGDGMQCKWRHWFHVNSNFEPAFDLWPDVIEMSAGELFPSPLLMADGSNAMLFSSCHAGTFLSYNENSIQNESGDRLFRHD